MAKNIVVERGENARPKSAYVKGRQTVVWRHEDGEQITIDFKKLDNVPFSDWGQDYSKTDWEVTGTVTSGIPPATKFKYKAKEAHRIKPSGNNPELIVEGGLTHGPKKKAVKTARKK